MDSQIGAVQVKNGITIRHDLQPGDLGLVTLFHARIYSGEYGYNHIFEAYVADSLAEFGKQYQPARDRLWVAERAGEIVGSIGLLAREANQSQLRWLLVDESTRGQGLGRKLLERCIAFAREAGYDAIYLWTVHTLEAAATLYEREGFALTNELPPSTLWGPELAEQRYDLDLNSAAG
jgi:GNAT superfamily N-acetyltransferase